MILNDSMEISPSSSSTPVTSGHARSAPVIHTGGLHHHAVRPFFSSSLFYFLFLLSLTQQQHRHLFFQKREFKALNSAQKRVVRKWAQADGYKDYQKVSSQEGFAHFYSELTQKFLVDVPHTEVGGEWDLEAVRSQLITYRRSLHTIHSRGRKVTSFFICLFFSLSSQTNPLLPSQSAKGWATEEASWGRRSRPG